MIATRGFIALSLVVAAMGCASAAAPGKVASHVQAMQEEYTAEKLVERGRAFASVGDFTRAEQYLAAAIDRGADAPRTLPLLLRVCIEARRFEAALEYAQPVLRTHPDDAHLRFVVASLYAMVGETKAAREELERILDARPTDATVQFALATLLRDEIHDRSGADAHFREYLKLEPSGAHVDEARESLLRSVP